MSKEKNSIGMEKKGRRSGFRAWLSGLTRGQKIRFWVLGILAVLLLMTGVGFAVWHNFAKMPEIIEPDDIPTLEDMGELPAYLQGGRKDGIYTFLVAGKDVTSGGTDTMLLISYNIKNKTITGVNLPRDTMINTDANSKRLNAVYARNRGSRDLPEEERVKNGMQALQKEVAKITGIMPDFYVLVEWEAIGKLVEAVGGVYFEVPFDMVYNDPYQNLHINQKQGYRLLNGSDAMQVIRFRKNDDRSISLGDVGRMKIQQGFLRAVAKKCLQPATLLKIPELAKIFSENVTTNLSVGNIVALAQKAVGMNPETDVSFETLPIASSFLYRSAALITLDAEGILEIINNGMNPYLHDIEKTDLELVVRNSNGSFSVTSGTVADSQATKPSVSKPVTKPTEQDEPDKPIEPDEPTTKPQQPTQQPQQPTQQPQTPQKPQTPQTPQKPAEPQKPVEPQKPDEPEKPVEPQQPTEPPKPTEPETPAISAPAVGGASPIG